MIRIILSFGFLILSFDSSQPFLTVLNSDLNHPPFRSMIRIRIVLIPINLHLENLYFESLFMAIESFFITSQIS